MTTSKNVPLLVVRFSEWLGGRLRSEDDDGQR